jgi:beta-galactosidase
MVTTAPAIALAEETKAVLDPFLYAGDFPYFRLPRSQWAPTLVKLHAANLNTVTVTVPWSWHEPEEGEFDLRGERHGQRDLYGALELCAAEGLRVILRPGPHIGSGWRHGGVPDWLLRSRPQILALDAAGRRPSLDMCYPPITYSHPAYEANVGGWYDQLLPLLRGSQHGTPCSIVAVQIDDRPSYWWGLQGGDPLFVDYNPWIVGRPKEPGRYQRWLATRYGEIERLNERYGTRYDCFEQVPPPRRPLASLADLPWFSDWRRCKMDLLNQHLEFLYDWLRDGSVDVPIIILYPYQSPLAARRCAEYFRVRHKPVLIAAAPEARPFFDRTEEDLDLGQVVGMAEMARRWVQGTGCVPAGLETPGAHPTRSLGDDIEVRTALQLGHGMNALSFAPMVSGESPAGYGLTSSHLHDRSAPIGVRGDLRPHYTAISRLGQFLRTSGGRLLRTAPLADVAFGWYEPYENCGQQGDLRALGWRDDYRDLLCARIGLAMSGASSHGGGLLELVAMAGLNYAMLDLERDTLEEWLSYPQLWVLGLDFMSAPVQRDLVSYVEAGGHLVMLPRVPYLDEDLRPCTVLEALFPARPLAPQPGWPTGHRRMPFHAVALNDGRELGVADYVDTFDLPPRAEALAWEWQSCRPCAYCSAHGRGTATLLGFIPAPAPDGQLEHKRFLNDLANHAHVRRHAACDSLSLHVVERCTPPGSPDPAGYLFVVNPYAWPARSRLTYTDPLTGAPAFLPRTLKSVDLAGQSALILPLELSIPPLGLTIAYCTSQVQSWEVEGDELRLSLYGPSSAMGELAFRAGDAHPAPAAAAHTQCVQHKEAGLVTYTYLHHHQGTTLLRFRA